MFIQNYRAIQRNCLFDLLIRRASDETLFGSSLRINMPKANDALIICEQCTHERDWHLNHSDSITPSLWNDGLNSRDTFLRHTLSIGCWWSESVRFNKIPKEFILEPGVEEYDTIPEMQHLLIVGEYQ